LVRKTKEGFQVTPKITFIVSAWNDPYSLRCCLASLVSQTETNWEAIVCDNSTTDFSRQRTQGFCWDIDPLHRVRYEPTFRLDPAKRSCYFSAEWALPLAQGEWVCFPSDDSYYVPQFADRMLQFAVEDGCDLAICDFVWGREETHAYCEGAPRLCSVDKTTFIIKRDKMIAFPGKEPDGSRSNSDGYLIEELVKQGIKWLRVPHLLVVHNP
jgi:Glycosyl transferase family 2